MVKLSRVIDRISTKVEPFDVRSADGVRIRAYKAGRGPLKWLLVPGLGTPLLVWKHVMERFGEKMTMVTWDQRGCFDSELPPLEQLGFERHVEDGLAVLDALRWAEPFVTGSWSMGVQLGLEIFKRKREEVRALTLINGAFEHVLHTAYGPKHTTPLLRAGLRGVVRAAPLLAWPTRRILASGLVGTFMHRARVCTNNAEFVKEVTMELANVDLGAYFTSLIELDKHSCRAVLPFVDVPTLVTAGGKDVATPPELMRELHEAIPGSEYLLIPNGTHYTPLEYPVELNEALDRFFAKVFSSDW